MNEKTFIVRDNKIVQVPRGTWENRNRSEDPEKPNHLFDSHKPFRGKDDVKKLNNLLKRLNALFGSGEDGFDSGFRNGPNGKMRATYHSGRTQGKNSRTFSAKHNDRNFDSETDHIMKDRTGNNILWNWCGDECSFDEGEQMFYETVFSEQLKFSNETNIKQGHKERVKTMEQWRKNKQHCPEETIIQIGKMNNHPDVEKSVECFKEFLNCLENWNNLNGNPFRILNWAFHQDEQGAPHFHLRKVWFYKDYEKGFYTTGQEEALRRTDIKLPDSYKKESRKNNRKITFDKMCREKWIEIARDHGLEIEDNPKPKKEEGLSLEEYRRRQEQERNEIYRDLVEFAELNVAMAEKVSEWEEVAKTADNADVFLEHMVDKAYHAFSDETQKAVVEEIKGYYACEAKRMEEKHRKEIAEYERMLNPKPVAPVVKKEKDCGMER